MKIMLEPVYLHTAHIICGLPGSGKTTFGRKLACQLSAVLLDIDTCTERMVRVGLELSGHDPADRDSPFFKLSYREPVYETMFDIAAENLINIDAVIVGPFTKEIQDPSWLVNLTTKLKSNVRLYYIHCDPSIRRDRLVHRGNPRDAAKIEDWDKHCSYYGDNHLPVVVHEYIDNSLS
jgi:predicted kinase